MRKLPSAFIFDMDGTMIDSEPHMTTARAELFTRFGMPLSFEQNIRTGTHKSIYWAKAIAEYAIPYSVDELITMEQDEAAEIMKKEIAAPSNGLVELLDFAKANGIGPKTAARIVLELKDKLMKEHAGEDLSSLADSSIPASSLQSNARGKLSEATDALIVLGYSKADVQKALSTIDTQSLEVSEIIRKALAKLF